MKAIFITFNQAYYESILIIMSHNNIRGFTHWDDVSGRGSSTGDPHYGSHAWPTLNGAIWAIVEERKVTNFLKELRELDEATPEQGLRAFVMNVENQI